jgi:hypothetical protein
VMADDLDEETVVRPRTPPPYTPSAPQPQASLAVSPWRIIVPSVIVLVVVFGAVFLLTRGSGQIQTNQNNQTQNGLTVDPNSQPVEAGSPPTGATEHGIESLPTATPATGSASPNANVRQSLPPTNVNGNFGANANTNRNSNQPREAPTPRPRPSPTVEKESPPPPLPKPSPTIKVVVKQSPTPL